MAEMDDSLTVVHVGIPTVILAPDWYGLAKVPALGQKVDVVLML